MRNFEHYLARNGVLVRKFFLHLSKAEQQKRFLERLNDPDKNWKFSSNDAKEREYWDDYMKAYDDMIRNTATDYAPWYVVPADNKWFTRVVVAAAVIECLGSLDLEYPVVGPEKLKELEHWNSLAIIGFIALADSATRASLSFSVGVTSRGLEPWRREPCARDFSPILQFG